MADSQSSLTTASGSVWTREQDKEFENALNTYGEDTPNRWEEIASQVTGKDAAEVKRHYEILQEDINLIDSGRIALPSYRFSSLSLSEEGAASDSPGVKKGASFSAQVSGPNVNTNGNANGNGNAASGGKGVSSKTSDQERRKGIPWSEEEHRLFLLGLAKFGKGDWRSISRNFVISRTPTQVASHAQKYFIRLNSINKDKRRSSIHDITSVNNGDAAQQGQGPITGQPGPGSAAGQPIQGGMQSGIYPRQQMIGQPPAVGAPVMLPPPGHVSYGSRGHLPRPVMPGQQIGMAPHMSYPMSQPVCGP
ncbi:transcription factor SRM1 isoform X2 [Physcomitrium patens]|uniref:Uncharacterized protein n=1 Tax=Physcomitrium patens TaxID=3218 RepID=A0A7I4DI57_PHYPA|nr:transcription factor SRM1-like isoform X2 [Physcomitrium patens]|eukprot:XP_024373094.1 transcription factor SRM1-like isoform X2 [Physcomitrella patens]